ncbi:MAG: hypothetical protein ACTHM9_14855 [Gemmatimonadales bacterium]|jgi:hypothetical protein
MRPALIAPLTALAVVGCGGHAVQIDSKAQPVGGRWNGVLSTPASLAGVTQVHGNAWMQRADKDSAQTLAHVEITNAAPGGRHPWHVHRGQCGTDLGILGPPDAYQVLKVGGDGKAKDDAKLPLPLPSAGQYFVNVHASAQNMSTIVACGNLAPPAR